MKSAREGLRYDLTVALHQAATESGPVFRPGLLVKTNGDFTTVNLTVEPVATGETEPTLYLVVLEDVPTTEELSPVQMDTAGDDSFTADSRIALLTKELQAKEDYLRRANEELETSIEDLKSANAVAEVINLIQSDVGRPLAHVVSNLTGYNQMVEDVQEVLEALSNKNIEVKTKSGIWFLMDIRPY